MSADAVLLKEYFESSGLDRDNLTKESLNILRSELEDAGEYGLANLVSSLVNPNDLLDYLWEEK